jgi:hypothetical protein
MPCGKKKGQKSLGKGSKSVRPKKKHKAVKSKGRRG